MLRCRSAASRRAALGFVCALLAAPSLRASVHLDAIATEVYHVDFESGLDAVSVIGPAVTLTTDPSEVIEGAASLKLSGPHAAVALRADVLPLQPGHVYIVEYRYHAIASAVEWALGVGFSTVDGDGAPGYVPLRGPVAAAGTAGLDTRSARANAATDAFVFHTWDGTVVIDDIRILRHDVQSSVDDAPAVTTGFPRLANYSLLAPDTIAFINHASQDEVERIDARYDLMTGTSIDHTLGAAGWVRRLKMLNPSLRILPYKEAFMAQFDSGVDGQGLLATYNAGLQSSWFMRQPSGALVSEPWFPQNVQLNHTPVVPPGSGAGVNDYTAGYLADTVLASGLWSGIHFDQPEWYINPLLGTPPPEIDLDGDGIAEATASVQHAWALGFYDYFARMSRRLGAGTLLFGNAGHIPGNPFVLPMLNGWEGEVISPYPIAPGGDWITSEASAWYRLFDNYRLATRLARAPQIVSLQFTGRDLGTQTGGLTPNGYPQRTPQLETRDYRRVRLGLTTALLGDGFFEYDLVDNTTLPQWFDEYSVDAAGVATGDASGKGYLGQPLGEANELSYPARPVFQLDFESATPAGVVAGPGTITTAPGEVIAGGASLVIRQSDIVEGKWMFASEATLVPGRTYQLFADYRILDYRPTTFAGLLGIGFRDDAGALTPERSASLFLPDTGGPGQQGTLRASVKVSRADTPVVGGLADTGTVAIDNIRLVEGTGGVWRRDFENGVVLVNPTPEALFVSQGEVAGVRVRNGIRRLKGTQAPWWNDGSAVNAGIWIPSGDGIVLLADHVDRTALSAPAPPQVSAGETEVTLWWTPVAQDPAGYTVQYGEDLSHLGHAVEAGPTAWARIDDLAPGTRYVARVSAHDFLGRPGPSTDVMFATTGTAPRRPTFSLGAESPSIAPGSLVVIEGADLADAAASSSGPMYPLTLGGTTVRVNGIAAPLLGVSPNRVWFLVPWETTPSRAVVSVSRDGVEGPWLPVPVVAARPWIVTWTGSDIAIATHGDGTLVSADSPVAPGEPIDVLAVGLGTVLPHPDSGVPASGPHPGRAAGAVSVQVAGTPAGVTGAWLVAGTASSYGVRFTVPPGTLPGLQSIALTVDGAHANVVRLPIQ